MTDLVTGGGRGALGESQRSFFSGAEWRRHAAVLTAAAERLLSLTGDHNDDVRSLACRALGALAPSIVFRLTPRSGGPVSWPDSLRNAATANDGISAFPASPASQTGGDPAGPKFVATTAVNMTTCILKDQAFARMYGGGKPKPTPAGSYFCWFLRDASTMGIVFSLPTIVGPIINPENPSAGTNTAQIIMPILWQPVSTPLHLLGYEIFNNPEGTVADRIAFLKSDYFRTVGIRIVRMAPPWSFGTIANRTWRESLHDMLGA